MKISALITKLKEMKEIHGDVLVVHHDARSDDLEHVVQVDYVVVPAPYNKRYVEIS